MRTELPTPTAPLSTAQERLWFADAAAPGNVTYNVPLFFRSTERVDPAVLARALERVTARHETLRTGFRLQDGVPVQVVAAPGPVAIEQVDLAGVANAADTAWSQARVRARAPFDLATGPVVRCTLWTGLPGGDAMLLCLHHIAVDGWSLAPLVEELTESYRSEAAGRSARLPELRTQYRAYAAAERAEADSSAMRRQTAARAAQLAPVVGRPALAGALPTEPAVEGSRPGDQLRFAVPAAVVTAVEELALSLRVTPYVVFATAVEALVHRWSGRDRFLLGAMAANRQRAELEPLIGFFVNTVPIDCQVDPARSFRALCGTAKRELLRVLSHQRIPYDRLTAAVTAERGGEHRALVEVGFVLQNAAPPKSGDRPLWGQPRLIGTGTAKFDLMLILDEEADGHTLTIEYDTDRYPAGAVRELGAGYVALLGAAVADPDQRVDALPGGPASFELPPPEPTGSPAGSSDGSQAGTVPTGVAEVVPLDEHQRLAATLFLDTLATAGSVHVRSAGHEQAGHEQAGHEPARRERPLSAGANFFALGGHSLLAVTMLATAQRQYGVVVAPREFLAEPTVAGLGRLLARATAEAAAAPAATAGTSDSAPRAADVPADALHPATVTQQRFWTIDRIPTLRSAYLIPTVIEYSGPVDVVELRRAVDAVLARHPALRSRFALDRKLRRVAYRTDGGPARTSVTDARGWSAAERHGHLAELCWRGFDLAVDAPARAELLVVEGGVLLVLVVHHIVADGWSRQLLLGEIARAYAAGTTGGEAFTSPAAHPADLADLADPAGPAGAAGIAASAKPTNAAVAEAVIAHLSGTPTDIALPYDRPRGEMQRTEGACRTARLPDGVADRVRTIAQSLACTPFMTAAALLAVVLARRSEQKRFLFAFPWSGRQDADSSDAVGMFVNTLALRVDLSGDPSWRELLLRVAEESRFGYRHAQVPFDDLVAALHRDRDLSRPPLTPVYLNHQDAADAPPPLGPGITATAIDPDPLHLKYELELVVTSSAAGTDLALSYAVHLFDATTVDAILADLLVAAADLAADPDSHPV